jgi:hypothetical protein
MNLRRILAVFLGTMGIALLILAISNVINVPQTSMAAYYSIAARIFGLCGLGIIAIAVLVYRSTSSQEAMGAIFAGILILISIILIIYALISIGSYRFILFGIPGLAIGDLGWRILDKSKYPTSITKRLLNVICLPSGAGAVVFAIVFAGGGAGSPIIAVAGLIGVALIVIGTLLRRYSKT